VNAQLFEQLREANRTKDEFLSNLSHELRTPLTPILGWLHLLKPRVAQDPLAAEGLATVERNAQQLAGLIEDLLDLTRIVSGKVELKRVAMDLAPLIETVFAQHSAQAGERHIQMRLSLPAVPILSD